MLIVSCQESAIGLLRVLVLMYIGQNFDPCAMQLRSSLSVELFLPLDPGQIPHPKTETAGADREWIFTLKFAFYDSNFSYQKGVKRHEKVY